MTEPSDRTVWDDFADTILIVWDDRGLPGLLGPGHGRPADDDGVGPLVHTLTGFDPGGPPADPQANAAAHRHLVARIEALGCPWEPVVGASPDAAHHELGVATTGLTRAEAVAIGVDHHQLAIFEIDDQHLTLVPCDGGTARPLEDRWSLVAGDITRDHVIAWRDEHEAITGHRLPRTHCPRCRAPDPSPIMYGFPMGPPPDWVAVGGCVITDDQPHLTCRTCDHSW